MLDEVLQRVRSYSPRLAPVAADRPQAAVLMPLTRKTEPELVLTLRSSALSSHSGEVAFPGGRRDPGDPDLLFTALREAQEEVGLAPSQVEVVGPLSPLLSRFGIHVSPYVGVVPQALEYQANIDEIDSVFSVPLGFFLESPREVTHRIDVQGASWYVPCYHYEGYKIWGLTALMIVELVNVACDAAIDLSQPPSSASRIITL